MGADGLPSAAARPTVRLRDHARVLWLLVKSLFTFVPYLVYVPLPWLGAWMRRRLRRRLASMPPPELRAAASLWAEVDAEAFAGRRIFLVAGEASGDRMAARVVRELKERAPDVEIVGYAGPACAEAGMRVDRDLTANAVMGVVAVIASIGFWWRVCAETLARFRDERPDLVLTVDFPGLNVRLLQWARRAGIRTVHLVAPQVWAHAPWRVWRWRRAVDHLLSTMPFEPSLFARSGIRTTYVGHPLFEAPLPPPRSAEARPVDGLKVELWPGSRSRELAQHVPILARAADRLRDLFPEIALVMPLAHERHRALAESLWVEASPDERLPTIQVGTDGPDPALVGALVTSGTATAQAAVDLVPQVVFYRIGVLLRIGSWLGLSTPFICLANLVAGREVAAEHLVGGRGAADTLVEALRMQIDTDEAYAAARKRLEVVRERLSAPDVASRTAALVASELR